MGGILSSSSSAGAAVDDAAAATTSYDSASGEALIVANAARGCFGNSSVRLKMFDTFVNDVNTAAAAPSATGTPSPTGAPSGGGGGGGGPEAGGRTEARFRAADSMLRQVLEDLQRCALLGECNHWPRALADVEPVVAVCTAFVEIYMQQQQQQHSQSTSAPTPVPFARDPVIIGMQLDELRRVSADPQIQKVFDPSTQIHPLSRGQARRLIRNHVRALMHAVLTNVGVTDVAAAATFSFPHGPSARTSSSLSPSLPHAQKAAQTAASAAAPLAVSMSSAETSTKDTAIATAAAVGDE